MLLLGLAQPLFQVVDDFYRGRVYAIEDGEIVAGPVAEEYQVHHLAQRVLAAAIDNLMADGILLQ